MVIAHFTTIFDLPPTQSTSTIVGETTPNNRRRFIPHPLRRPQATNLDDVRPQRGVGGISHLHGNIQLQILVLQLYTNLPDESLELGHGVVELLRQGPEAKRL